MINDDITALVQDQIEVKAEQVIKTIANMLLGKLWQAMKLNFQKHYEINFQISLFFNGACELL